MRCSRGRIAECTSTRTPILQGRERRAPPATRLGAGIHSHDCRRDRLRWDYPPGMDFVFLRTSATTGVRLHIASENFSASPVKAIQALAWPPRSHLQPIIYLRFECKHDSAFAAI